jgi:hypothetical protein
VTEDEAKAVAAVAAQCLTWSGWRRWEPVMRYGRLFTPGAGVVSGHRGMSPDLAGGRASRRALDSGLLYAEGYACYPRAGGVGFPWAWAWCLDGETVADLAATRQGTAYFGVALRPRYLRRVLAAQAGVGRSEGFRWAFARGDQESPPLDPAADLALDVGRDIPPAVREWALTAGRHPGPARRPPGWVLEELLGADAPCVVGQDPFHGLFIPAPGREQEPDPAPAGPYARYVVRLAEWFNSGMALQCGGQAGAYRDGDGHIVGMIHDGDSVAMLTRMADEHRPRCEWEGPAAGEEGAGKPAFTPAEARLQSAGRTFAVLRRLEHHTWDAWLRPAAPDPDTAAAGQRVTRGAVSYEMAFAAVFRALGAAMPADFTTAYAGEQPDPPLGEARLPVSYERHLVRRDYGQGMALQESGQTAGISGREGTTLAGIADGTSLAALIQVADERWPLDGWTLCPERERMDPELTVQRNAEVDLCWGTGGERYFASLHRLADGTWDAWLTPTHERVQGRREEPTELLTPAGVSYEMALAAVMRAMGDDMPAGFGLNYLDKRITPGLPGPAQA